MPHLDQDRLVDLGAGWEQPSDAETAHLMECPTCPAELAEIRTTAARAREASQDGGVLLEDPPPHVWQRTVSEAEFGGDNVRELPVQQERHGRRRIAVLMTATAAAGAIVGSALTGAITYGGAPTPPGTGKTVVASTRLNDLGARDGSGTAQLVSRDGQRVLIVRTAEVTVQGAYLEVWLRNPGGNKMYALGALPEHGPGRFTVPEGISLTRFSVVDVSVQQFNGEPGHSQTSVLRGSLEPR